MTFVNYVNIALECKFDIGYPTWTQVMVVKTFLGYFVDYKCVFLNV